MVNVWFEYVWVDALDSVENPPVFFIVFFHAPCHFMVVHDALQHKKYRAMLPKNIKPPIKPPFTQGTQGLVSLLGGILTTVKYLLQIIFPILGGCKKWINMRHVSTLESKYIPFYPSKMQWYSIIPQKMFVSAMVLFKEFILSSLNSH